MAGTEQHWPADLGAAAGHGLYPPPAELLAQLGVATDARGNAQASTDAAHGYATSVPRVFAAGDMALVKSPSTGHPDRRRPRRGCLPRWAAASCRVENYTLSGQLRAG